MGQIHLPPSAKHAGVYIIKCRNTISLDRLKQAILTYRCDKNYRIRSVLSWFRVFYTSCAQGNTNRTKSLLSPAFLVMSLCRDSVRSRKNKLAHFANFDIKECQLFNIRQIATEFGSVSMQRFDNECNEQTRSAVLMSAISANYCVFSVCRVIFCILLLNIQ